MFTRNDYPYPSKRHIVYGYNGMVATGNHLAAEVGMDILKKGGNAVDAALAVALTLPVVEPTANGLGGDLFAIVHMNGEYDGISAHGAAAQTISINALKARGFTAIPETGVIPVTVPGMIGGITALWQKYASLPFGDLVLPAIAYANNGYALQPGVADGFNRAAKKYGDAKAAFPELETWFEVFGQGKTHFAPGDRIVLKSMARGLEAIAETEGASFYTGDVAEAIARTIETYQGFLTKQDLAAYTPEWTSPLSVTYKGHTVFEIPPSGHGISVLMALKTLLQTGYTTHTAIEALKLALSHVMRYVADRDDQEAMIREMLENYPNKAAAAISDQAIVPEAVDLIGGGTVYLATADQWGNMVSLIQSNYMGFGSGVVVPEYGIALHNRACNFAFEESSPNALRPGKRPYHTIIPGFIEKKNEFKGPFGVMGAFMQPQGHLQVLLSLIDDGLNIQSALDRPRWQWLKGKKIVVESSMAEAVVRDLKNHGHDLTITDDAFYGRGQIILRREEDGLLMGACEPRTDSAAVAW